MIYRVGASWNPVGQCRTNIYAHCLSDILASYGVSWRQCAGIVTSNPIDIQHDCPEEQLGYKGEGG